MLTTIESLLDGRVLPDQLNQQCCALISFYRSPPPFGYQYHWNCLWVMGSGFNQLYKQLQTLLWETIDAAKAPATKRKRQIEAAQLAVEIWERGHHFDEETGMAIVVPTPPPPRPPTEKEKALRNASIQATWRNRTKSY